MSKSFNPVKETDVLREIILYLRYQHLFFFRVNTTGTFDPVRKIFLKPYNLTPGTSDLFVLKSSHLYAIEAKSAKGKQSPEQVEFQKRVEANGGTYVLARCVQDVINAGI
jgi:hypothetical protein